MERELFKILDLELRIGKLNKKFELSDDFEWIHNNFILFYKQENYFNLTSNINVKRKDQLLLNLQYNNLIYGYNIYNYTDYCKYVEEFFTYFLNYELTTGRCSPEFPKNVKKIFYILNKYNV